MHGLVQFARFMSRADYKSFVQGFLGKSLDFINDTEFIFSAMLAYHDSDLYC